MLELVLVVGKVFFLVVLYLFVLLVIRSAVRDLRTRPSAVVQAEAAPLVVAPPSPRSAGRVPASVPAQAGSPAPDVAGEWELVVVESRILSAGSAVALPVGRRVRVGRAPDNDIQLRDTFVSSHHAVLQADPDGVVVTDLGSTNGTFVDGEEISRPEALATGARVAVGDTVFEVARG